MERYEFFEHTGDAKFKAYGETIEDRFSNAAVAMASVIVDPKEIRPEIEKTFEVQGTDEKQLLYNWLEELLFLLDADGFFLHDVKEIVIEKVKEREWRLVATLVGDSLKDDYLVYGSVKAVTYAEMEIEEDFVQVVVDI